MPIERIDHIYVETRRWEATVAFWRGLGFSFTEQWGSEGHRAGRLQVNSAAVVLAEVGEDQEPACDVFFALSDADAFAPGNGGQIRTSLEDTHWGTRWIRVADPEGRVFALEEGSD